jgi:uncharacterized tellurite resistance protein B-like protein
MKFEFFSTGQYALVDIFYRNIWFNTYDEKICHDIRRVFQSKMGMLVFDLASFSNYSEGLIDSLVCLNWQVINNDMERIKNILKDSSITDKTHCCIDNNFQLTNQPVDNLLSDTRCQEIQYQIYAYYRIVEQFKITHDSNNAADIITELDQIFQTEIHMDTIESKVYRLAEEYLNISPLLSGKILTFLNKNYE